jgi:hypothetical protein
METPTAREIADKLTPFVGRYRQRCLWFFREDFVPSSREEAIRVLDCVERYGDREGFVEARRLRSWLSPSSSEESAGS